MVASKVSREVVLGLGPWVFGLWFLVFGLCTLHFVLGLLKVKLLCHDVKVQSTKYKDQKPKSKDRSLHPSSFILHPLLPPNPAHEYKRLDDRVKSRAVPDRSGRIPQLRSGSACESDNPMA